jgi:hypothetical protein
LLYLFCNQYFEEDTMRYLLKISLLVLITSSGPVANAQSLVKFLWKPPTDVQNALVGNNVTVSLWAMPTGAPVVNISGMEAVVAWDATKLQFSSYTPFAQPNNTFIPGTNNGDMNMFDFNPTFSVPAVGTRLGDFTFKTLGVGTTFISMMGSDVIQSSSGAFGGQTIVYRLDADGGNFVPDHSSLARINISQVPEPQSFAAVGMGLAVLLKRRSRKH